MADDERISLRDAAFDLGPAPQIVVDGDGALAAANQQAKTLFGLAAPDIGRPLQDLEIPYRPVKRRAGIGRVPWISDGAERRLEIEAHPIVDRDHHVLGTTVTFTDVTETLRLHDALETAYEELQSTVEELETTNEELQSTNAALETMNEELRSTNGELETMSDELRRRTTELDDVNASLETILSGLGVAVAVLDANQVVRLWNLEAVGLWGPPLEELRGQLREALAGQAPPPVVLDATSRRGRAIRCKVTAVPLALDGHPLRRAILLMQSLEPAAGGG